MKKSILSICSALTIVFAVVLVMFSSCKKEEDGYSPDGDSAFKVVSVTPADNSNGVSVYPEITITFNKDFDVNYVMSCVKIAGPNNQYVSYEFVADKNILAITPRAQYPLKVLTKYSINIEGLPSIDGLKIKSFSSVFVTNNIELFKVSSMSPEDGATEVKLNELLVINFVDEIKPEEVTSCVRLFDSNNNEVALEYEPSRYILFLELKDNKLLKPNTKYTIKISGLHSIYGKLIVDFASSFTTTVNPPLQIISITPANGSTNVPINTKITVEFSKKLWKNNPFLCTMKDNSGMYVITDESFDGDKTVVITPRENLKKNMVYTFKFDIPIWSDGLGEEMQPPSPIYFTTINN